MTDGLKKEETQMIEICIMQIDENLNQDRRDKSDIMDGKNRIENGVNGL